MEESYIQFIANYAGWKAIRKIKVDEKTKDTDVVYFLMSLSQSFDNKIEISLRKAVALEKLDAVIKEAGSVKKAGSAEIASVLEFANSRKVNQAINEISEKEGLSKDEKEALKAACKVYALKKILTNNGLLVDYSQVKIPGTRKPKGAAEE